MITLIACSRIKDNKNHRLPYLIDSLIKNSYDFNNFELIIKFDDDDDVWDVPNLPFRVTTFVSPRGNGYLDLHVGYYQTLRYMDDRTTVIGAVADDFSVVLKDWDKHILDNASGDYFIIHGRKNTVPFNNDLSNISSLIIDEGPLWSRKLLMSCSCNWGVSFTDAWTIAIGNLLAEQGYEIRRYLPKIYHRKINAETDFKGTERWENGRKDNMNFIQSDFYKELVYSQVENIKNRMGGFSWIK